MEGYDIVAPF